MPITVKILKRSAGGRTLYATRDLDVLPITIGRDATCTIALDDPFKHMSRLHVQIEQDGGGKYWMSVVSKVNPVTVKGQRHGPGARLSLQSGDSFELAEYEVQVLLPEPTPAPAPRAPVAGAADHAERLFNEATFGDETAPPPEATYIPQRRAQKLEEPPPEATFIPARPAPAPAPRPAPASSNPLSAFMEAAGLPRKELSPAEAQRVLRDGGAVLRAAIEGLMMLLLARAEMRKDFDSETRATQPPDDDNPLKLMSSPQEAMEFFFSGGERTAGLLEPAQAVGDAYKDLRLHQLAVMAGMRAAMLGALERLDPSALEKRSKGGGKTKLWDFFVAEHEKLARATQRDFNTAFGRDFIEAYQAELQRLKAAG